MSDEEIKKEFFSLLESSEKRIDKTNEMIDKMTNTIFSINGLNENMLGEYTKHLDKLSFCRDSLLKQNQELIQLVQSLRADLERERHWHHNDLERERLRYDNLLESVIKIAGKNGSANNINIK